jgi:hypothetical protein
MPSRTLPLLALALLAGCAAPQPAVPAPPPEPMPPASEAPAAIEPPPLKELLAYADRTYRMPAPELAAEIARLGPLADTAPERRLELALALSQTRQPPDTARALALVQGALGQAATLPAQRAFARLLENRLQHQRRLEEQADRQALQIKDLQRKNDQLGERLDAVRAIERSLNTKP